jgi:hypothetical protein
MFAGRSLGALPCGSSGSLSTSGRSAAGFYVGGVATRTVLGSYAASVDAETGSSRALGGLTLLARVVYARGHRA